MLAPCNVNGPPTTVHVPVCSPSKRHEVGVPEVDESYNVNLELRDALVSDLDRLLPLLSTFYCDPSQPAALGPCPRRLSARTAA